MTQRFSSIVDILFRYQQREELSGPEKRILEDWLRASDANQDLFDEISNEAKWNAELENLKARDGRDSWSLIRERIESAMQEQKPRPTPWRKYAAVAAIFAAAVLGTYLLIKHNSGMVPGRTETQDDRFKNDVHAAAPMATLTLADGRLIRLDTIRAGRAAGEDFIRKMDSDHLLIQSGPVQPDGKWNTLTTATGTRYRISLPDGSRAWLNAGSSLQFPSSFNGDARHVILNGEACFEIAPDPGKPFSIEAGGSETRVLGTRFNVRDYPGETNIRITLVEGLLRFRAGRDSLVLLPGQQASLRQSGRISVDSVNTAQAMAWREDLFWFQSETFENIMGELSRWYPIHVRYQGSITEKFTGILPRGRSLIEVLKTLELTGYVNFQIKGNEVEVIPLKTPPNTAP